MCHNLFPHFIPLFLLSLDVLPLFLLLSLSFYSSSSLLLLSLYSYSVPLSLLLIKVKKEGVKASSQWCKRRGIEEQRLYEMVKLRQQFRDVLLVSIIRTNFMFGVHVFLFYFIMYMYMYCDKFDVAQKFK